jgi:hypothetical protein
MIRVDDLANTMELAIWFDSLSDMMFLKKDVDVADRETLKTYKVDYEYFENDHIFLTLQGYTICFNLYDRNADNQESVRYATVKKDLVGKVTRKLYDYNKKANRGEGAFC